MARGAFVSPAICDASGMKCVYRRMIGGLKPYRSAIGKTSQCFRRQVS